MIVGGKGKVKFDVQRFTNFVVLIKLLGLFISYSQRLSDIEEFGSSFYE
jgi:hypothetical protein